MKELSKNTDTLKLAKVFARITDLNSTFAVLFKTSNPHALSYVGPYVACGFIYLGFG